MGKYTRGLLAVILAVVLVLPAAAFAMLPEANARSSTGMDGPTVTVDPNTSENWTYWAAGSDGSGKITTQKVGRIWTDKTVEAGEESDFVTTLSAISSTSNTITTVPKPLDIVLVLDASGSMNDPMGGGDTTKRIDALKTAAGTFIDKIAEENAKISDESKRHQVAIVKFSGDKTTKVGNDTYREGGHTYNHSQTMKILTPCLGDGKDSLKSTVNSIRPAGATRADYGMELAEDIPSDREDAKKVVLFFTDGSPTSYSSFESSVADSAINKANSLKKDGTVIYTIGIFSGANPTADPTASGTINENKFMHAVSSNYPAATSNISYWGEWTINFGARAENANYYKSAKNAKELEEIFKDISESITEVVGYPTEVHDGYGEHKSGYITFTDELGDFMQVDGFTAVEYNGKTFTEPEKTLTGNVDTYTFTGEAANLVITVQRAAEGNPQQGDIVEVKIPASLIPLRNFNVDETKGTLTVNDVEPIRVKYASSVKAITRENLFTPDEVPGLKDYIEKNTTGEQGAKSVAFYANKWSGDPDLGDTVANFTPAATNRYYFFQKQTPIYMDPACTLPAKGQQASDLLHDRLYYYQDEFEVTDSSGKLDHGTTVIEFTGGRAAQFVGGVVADENGNLSFSEGTARLAFIYELHTDKKHNKTGTASDVLNPRWNDTSSKASATQVNSHLGNNGKISFAYNMKPATVDTKADFGLNKVLEGRDWTKEDEFAFELSATSENDAPMPESATAPVTVSVTEDDLNEQGHAAINFGQITYNEPGEYTYEVREVAGKLGGITYSDNVAAFKVTVTVNASGVFKADVEMTSGKTEFKNIYSAKTETPLTIEATKTLEGRAMGDDEFEFALSYAGHDEVLLETTNKGGKVEFGPLTYTTEALAKLVKEDKASLDASSDKPTWTIHYIAAEQTGGLPAGVSATVSAIDAYVTVVDNGDGTLTATAAYGDAGNIFVNTYSVDPLDADLDFDMSKAIDGRAWTEADEFSFTISPAEGTDAPLPDPATVTVTSQDAKDGIAAIKFGKIRYTAAGTYKYEIRENAGNAAGMTYDEHVATAEVTVTDNGKGVLTASVTKTENGRFTNTYRTELNYTAAGGLKLSKSLSGRPMTEGQFTFIVTPADAASANALGLHEGANVYKSPAATEGTVGLIDILAGKEVKFTQADAGKTFKYTVAETNDHKPGYTYDDAVRTVTIAVTDDGAGTITATTTVSGGPEGTHETIHKSGENKVESALVPFKNSYSASTDAHGGDVAQIVATKTLTGRPMVDGEFYFGIAYAGETEAIEGTCVTNVNGQVSFGALHYTTEMLADLVNANRAIRTDTDAKLAWTINYTAFEYTSPLAAKGITAAKPSFSFKVIVVDNGDGTLTATPAYDGIQPLFENVYGADAVDAALAGTKKLQAAEGLTPADIAGKFTFTVTADEAGAPMPERATATNDAAGNVDFGKIHFTLEDLNRALGVTDDATDKVEADEADEAEADEAEAEEADVDADANADEPSDESEPAAPIAPRSHTFTYTVTESGSAPGVTNDANTARKVSYTVTDDRAGHLSVVRNGDDGAAFTFTNTYSVTPTDSSVTDQVKTVKRLTGRDLAAGEFTFDLLEDGVTVASGTNDASGNVTLSPIRYEAPGTHTYTLREACPNALGLYKGVTYDSATYTIVTTVKDNGDGTLTATHKLEGATESAGFTNKYHAMPTQVSIGAIKVLEGRELKKDEFSFKLVGESIESTVTNDADGKISFDKFEYSEPGTYVYTISEVKGDEAGMTYDKSVFTATVNVVDDGGGNLKANVAFTKGDESVEGIVFNNTYKKPETPTPTPDPGTPKTVTNIVKTVKGFLPTTGDQQAAALLMAFVIAMAGVGALVWGIRKR